MTLRSHALGSHVLWVLGPVCWTGPSRLLGVAISPLTLAIVWTMATVIFRELVRMPAIYSSLRSSKSVRRRTQSAGWIPVSRSPSVPPPPPNSCWAAVI
eukprot:15005394-Alexandrium_andersonii.AAC.1